MQSVVLILLITLALIVGAIRADVQCKAMRPTANAVVVACSAGAPEVQP